MNQLKSGNTYSLQELFGGNHKIIIPDMQRDYTWGDKVHRNKKDEEPKELVSGFCNYLFDLFLERKNTSIPIGMIYAYPNPENHYHLIDGQQRITTLFLLMGMLHKHTELKELKERLISTFELEEDDQEPYLQYAIRESSLYFLSDLVVNFFFDGNSKKEVRSIRSEPWYFSEYNHDPSIKSMLEALDIIEKIIKNKDDLKGFSTWLIEKVTFFYFDMEKREHGEEMFVVINTTGEPLEVTEELKPLLIGDIPCEQTRKKLSSQWEERETFFWKNKKSSEHTADEGVKDFLIWYTAIQTKKEFPVKSYFNSIKQKQTTISNLDAVNTLFSTFSLITICDNEEIIKQFAFCKKTENLSVTNIRDFPKDVVENVFLPYLYFKWKFSESNLHVKFLRRLRKNHFNQKWQRGGYFDWRYILQIIEKVESPNEVLIFDKQLDKIEKHEIPKSIWYTEEEQIKDKLRNKNPENDTTLKEWEDHPDFMGDLSILLQAYLLEEKENSEYDFAELSRIMENYKAVIDPLRTGEVKDNALFNIFRLFRVYAGLNDIGHIPNTNWWDMRGVFFSDYNRNHLKLEKNDFLHVIKAKKPYEFCKNYIVHSDRINYDSFKSESFFDPKGKWFMTEHFIKVWFTLKVFSAIKSEKLLDHNKSIKNISAYADTFKNKIINDQKNPEFTLENSICGYAIAGGRGGVGYIKYAEEQDWKQSHNLYTPFAETLFITGTRNRNPDDGDIGLLAANKKAIDEIIEFMFQ